MTPWLVTKLGRTGQVREVRHALYGTVNVVRPWRFDLNGWWRVGDAIPPDIMRRYLDWIARREQ